MEILQHISLKPYHTFGIDVPAKYFTTFSSVEQLRETLLTREKSLQNIRLLVLGGGSNVLPLQPFEGLVMVNAIPGILVVSQDKDKILVKAGAGVNWHAFVMYCVENNFAGVENLALIPGSVGASPMQNIGAYGVELKDVFHSLEALEINTGKIWVFNKEACAFGYRDSVFKNVCKNKFIITSVTYQLSTVPVLNTSYGAISQELERLLVTNITIREIAQAVMNIRRSKLPDPAQVGNAGSFFKNPQVSAEIYSLLKSAHPGLVAFPAGAGYKLAAGWLIEQCGWKGYRKGDAGCYEKQALVLVNYGEASGHDIFELSENIINSVSKKFSLILEREVNLV